VDSHGFFLRSQGGEEAVVRALARGDLAAAPVSDAERALLRLVEVVTRHAYRTNDSDVEALRRHGWSEPQIAEAVYVTALFAFFNRVADAFGIDSQGYGGPRPEFPKGGSGGAPSP
jgi:alkylhydroperoxidase family enzyme